MKPVHLTWLLIALALLAFCRLGGARDLRADGPNRLRLGTVNIDVPAECVGSPHVAGLRKRFESQDLLLSALLPDFRCEMNSSGQVGDDKTEVFVLIGTFGPTVVPEEAIARIFERNTAGHKGANARTFIRRTNGEVYYTFTDPAYKQTHDAWQSIRNPSSYVICSRSENRKLVDGPWVGHCNNSFIHRGLLFNVRYGSAWAGQRWRIQEKAIAWFDAFTEAAAQSGPQ